MTFSTVRWTNGHLFIIDQTRLPGNYDEIELKTVSEVWTAIKTLQVRGAPAIGIAAAFGVLVALKENDCHDVPSTIKAVHAAADYLANSRPTAVNLFWALDRMRRIADEYPPAESRAGLLERLETEAIVILEEDHQLCRRIGEHGASLIKDGDGVLTHCNAGGLATGGYGTALGVLFRARELGRTFHVFVDETRPLLQGARLTAWELTQAGIDATLICDNMAGFVMQQGRVNLVVVGADRIAANGDTANKIGTYSVAVLARAHGIPFYVAAPLSTFDITLESGKRIPIEERAASEISSGFGYSTAPETIRVYNPAFDVTPAELITGIITERGVFRAPFQERIADEFRTGATLGCSAV